MPFLKKINKDFFIKDNRIYLSNDYIKEFHPKKITGSRIGAIIGLNKYVSPFQIWCQIVNIYKEEIDPTLAIVGNKIEPKIRSYVEKIMKNKYLVYDPKTIGWDVFKSNKIFGGVPDGEPIDENNNFLYDKGYPMLEIKTTSLDKLTYKIINNAFQMQKDENGIPIVKIKNLKRLEWFSNDNVIKMPNEYIAQLLLYLYLRNASCGLFAVAFLEPKDYANPDLFECDNHEIHLVELKISDRNSLNQLIKFTEDWYNKHIINNQYSPEMTEEDKVWLDKHLKVDS